MRRGRRNKRRSRLNLSVKTRIFVLVALLAGSTGALSACSGKPGGESGMTPMSYEQATSALNQWKGSIKTRVVPVQTATAAQDRGSVLENALPPINSFPLAADPGAHQGVTAEIFASVDKSGSGTDGWLAEVGKRFNEAGLKVPGGRTARVAIRRIDSGTGYEFISTRKHLPDAYSPANLPWIEMAKANGVKVSKVHAALAPNVAGIVMKTATAQKLWPGKKNVSMTDVVDASIQGKMALGYTNPFASATGLNFLVTMLQVFSKGNENAMLSQDVASTFEAFQKTVPFVAMTTPQMRDSVERDGGSLDAFVMAYQTFSQAATLRSGYEFIPFGFRHDNPLYAIGDVPADRRAVLDLFARFCTEENQKKMAAEYGFYPPIDWKEPYPMPSGKTMIAAQKLWKQRKDTGRPIAAVFVADVSGSMNGSKLALLKESLLDGSQYISSGNAIGLVAFSTDVSVLLPVKPFSVVHKAAFQSAARRLDADGSTAMYDAVGVALSMVLEYKKDHPDVRPMVFVLTDGENNAGAKFADAAPVIAGLKVPVYTIGFEVKVKDLAKLSSLVEAANINADEKDIRYKIGALFNAQM